VSWGRSRSRGSLSSSGLRGNGSPGLAQGLQALSGRLLNGRGTRSSASPRALNTRGRDMEIYERRNCNVLGREGTQLCRNGGCYIYNCVRLQCRALSLRRGAHYLTQSKKRMGRVKLFTLNKEWITTPWVLRRGNLLARWRAQTLLYMKQSYV
jgi:hypothetical protein